MMSRMISQRLRELRVQKNLSMQQVASELGVTRASVSKWELGLATPELGRLDRIAKLYEVSVGFILGDPHVSSACAYPVVKVDKVTKTSCTSGAAEYIETYPSTRNLTGHAFFVRVDSDIFTRAGLSTVPAGSLVLVDTSRAPLTGDVVFINSAKGQGLFATFNVIGGKDFYRPLTPEYEMLVKGKVEVVGVAIEAIAVTELIGIGHSLKS